MMAELLLRKPDFTIISQTKFEENNVTYFKKPTEAQIRAQESWPPAISKTPQPIVTGDRSGTKLDVRRSPKGKPSSTKAQQPTVKQPVSQSPPTDKKVPKGLRLLRDGSNYNVWTKGVHMLIDDVIEDVIENGSEDPCYDLWEKLKPYIERLGEGVLIRFVKECPETAHDPIEWAKGLIGGIQAKRNPVSNRPSVKKPAQPTRAKSANSTKQTPKGVIVAADDWIEHDAPAGSKRNGKRYTPRGGDAENRNNGRPRREEPSWDNDYGDVGAHISDISFMRPPQELTAAQKTGRAEALERAGLKS